MNYKASDIKVFKIKASTFRNYLRYTYFSNANQQAEILYRVTMTFISKPNCLQTNLCFMSFDRRLIASESEISDLKSLSVDFMR
jgi:hypothetical protein